MTIKGGQLVKIPFSYQMVNVTVHVNLFARIVSIHNRTVVLKLNDDMAPFTGMKITVKKKELKAMLNSEVVSAGYLSEPNPFQWE